MDGHSQGFRVRLGFFITTGIIIFIAAVFIIGRQRNLFISVYKINTTFRNVSGLQVGNNIRFSGINVGTVNKIQIENDSTVKVEMLIQKSVKQFIKSDSQALIGTSGLIGDRILILTRGSTNAPSADEGQNILSREPIETDAILGNLQVTSDNAAIISDQLSEIVIKVNTGRGILGRLIQDSSFAENINQTVVNLKQGSKGLDENMNAAKKNFLFRGYFKKKERMEKMKADSLARLKETQKSDSKKKK